MSQLYRRIFKSQNTGVETLRELLQMMFVSELLILSSEVWIVSPWVGNVSLIDNRAGEFDTLNPEWSRKEVRLIETLVALMTREVRVVIVTRDIENNKAFLEAVEYASREQGLESRLRIIKKKELHTKGILLSRSLLMGSMNLTYSGIEINDESIQYSIDREDIAKTRIEFLEYLGPHEHQV